MEGFHYQNLTGNLKGLEQKRKTKKLSLPAPEAISVEKMAALIS
jgi:hypothetical protein